MNITSKDIIQLLFTDKDSQQRVLKDFESLNEDQRFKIEQMLWDAYDAFYEWTFQKNLELKMIEIRKGKEELNEEINQKVRNQTNKEIDTAFTSKSTSADLSAIRDKLEAIIDQGKNTAPTT